MGMESLLDLDDDTICITVMSVEPSLTQWTEHMHRIAFLGRCSLPLIASQMLRHMALVRTEVSDELIASIIRVTRIGELGRTLA
jgi:hypothetical protein